MYPASPSIDSAFARSMRCGPQARFTNDIDCGSEALVPRDAKIEGLQGRCEVFGMTPARTERRSGSRRRMQKSAAIRGADGTTQDAEAEREKWLQTAVDGSTWTRMLGQHHPAGTADKAQAEYYRSFLEQEKSELEALLAAQTRRLTVCMTEGEMTPISHVRCAIRTTEGQLGVIDRMLKALLRRFPAEEDLRRRA